MRITAIGNLYRREKYGEFSLGNLGHVPGIRGLEINAPRLPHEPEFSDADQRR